MSNSPPHLIPTFPIAFSAPQNRTTPIPIPIPPSAAPFLAPGTPQRCSTPLQVRLCCPHSSPHCHQHCHQSTGIYPILWTNNQVLSQASFRPFNYTHLPHLPSQPTPHL